MESTRVASLKKRVEGNHTITRSVGDEIRWHCMEVDNNLKHLNQARLFDAWADRSEGDVTENVATID